jgi:hypothetical protein
LFTANNLNGLKLLKGSSAKATTGSYGMAIDW